MLNEKSDVNYWGPKLAALEIRLKHKSHEKILGKNFEIKYKKMRKKIRGKNLKIQ